MSDDVFLSALQKITNRALLIQELIEVAGALTAGGRSDQARELYRVWVAFNPGNPTVPVALFNCAVLQSDAGELEAARQSLDEALRLDPELLPAYVNLGVVFDRGGQPDQAISSWRNLIEKLAVVTEAAVSLKMTAYKQTARVLLDAQKGEQAHEVLREALKVRGDDREVIEQYMSLRLSRCEWPAAEPWAELSRETLVGSLHALSMCAYTDDPFLQLAAAARYVEQTAPGRPEQLTLDRRAAKIDLAGRRLRVGYISSDLRDHAIGYLMAELFEVHDRSQVEVFVYYCGIPTSDGLNTRTRAAVEHWREIRNLGDEEAARMIAADGIDILVDVNGHTRDCRTALFARRPAPVQVNWLGFPGSMGTPYHQYIVADEWIIPEESEIYYSEKVLRLPCYQPNDRRRIVHPERPSRAEAGLPDDAFVFCCFNAAHKITRFTFERWMAILRRCEGSVLWLLGGSDEGALRLRQKAEAQGVSGERLVFAPKLQNPHHLARYPLADLFLDTGPYGAHTTASDALWMGVPVLTVSGRCFASRVCGSLVRAAGLPELVCETPENYVEMAVALAHDHDAVARLKARLEAGRASCDLFDTDKLARHLEALYAEMAAEHAAGRTPTPELRNLESYFKIGLAIDHEAHELTRAFDLHGHYRDALAQYDRVRPLQPDGKLWAPETTAPSAAAAARPRLQPRERTRRAG